MKSFLYLLRTHEADPRISHLFEHLVIQAFLDTTTRTLGVDQGALGYIGGEAHKNLVFVEAWFYSAAIAERFAAFMEDPWQRTADLLASARIDLCIRQCEAEAREQWTVNKDVLYEQLAALKNSAWEPIDSIEPYTYKYGNPTESTALTVRKAAARYKSIVISTYLESPSFEDKAVFERLYVILDDSLQGVLDRHGWYALDVHRPHDREQYTFFAKGVTLLKKTMTNAQIEAALDAHFQSFDTERAMPYILDHFKEFSKHMDWIGRLRDQLGHTDTVIGNKAIAGLATPERIGHIIHSVKTRVDNVPREFARHLEYPSQL